MMIQPSEKTQKLLDLTVLRALIVFGGSTILFAILAILVTSGFTNASDEAVLLWINQYASNTFDTFFVILTELGGVVGLSSITLLLLAALLYRNKKSAALLVGLGLAGVTVLNLTLKSLFDRERPDLWEWIVTESHFSFPSGHATASMALAACLIVLLWKTRYRVTVCIAASLYVALIGISRLYLGVHYPTDIIGGWLLGAGWVALVVAGIHVYRVRNVSGAKKL